MRTCHETQILMMMRLSGLLIDGRVKIVPAFDDFPALWVPVDEWLANLRAKLRGGGDRRYFYPDWSEYDCRKRAAAARCHGIAAE